MLPRIDAETNSQEDFYLATPEYIYIIFYDYYKVFICIIYIYDYFCFLSSGTGIEEAKEANLQSYPYVWES